MESISSLLQEHRIFNPSKEFSQNANIGSMESYASMRQIANLDPLTHWNEQANKIHWFSKWETILDWKYPHAQWFKEGYTNAAFNCLDIHKNTPTMQKTALLWEREDGLRQSLTYEELYSKVCLLANALQSIAMIASGFIPI